MIFIKNINVWTKFQHYTIHVMVITYTRDNLMDNDLIMVDSDESSCLCVFLLLTSMVSTRGGYTSDLVLVGPVVELVDTSSRKHETHC